MKPFAKKFSSTPKQEKIAKTSNHSPTFQLWSRKPFESAWQILHVFHTLYPPQA